MAINEKPKLYETKREKEEIVKINVYGFEEDIYVYKKKDIKLLQKEKKTTKKNKNKTNKKKKLN